MRFLLHNKHNELLKINKRIMGYYDTKELYDYMKGIYF
jgi:hypothetical protein